MGYQRPLTGASKSGQFMGSTCWSRPQGDGKYPDAQYTIQGESNDPIDPVVDECQYVPVDASECLDFDVFRYVCGGEEEEDTSYWGPWEQWSDCSVDCGSGLQTRSRECIGGECDGDSSETQQCTLEPCDDDSATDSQFQDLGRGICRSSSGGVVGGWGGWPKSAGECRRMCE